MDNSTNSSLSFYSNFSSVQGPKVNSALVLAFSAYYTLASGIATFILNSIVLVVCLRKSELRSPFMYYVIHLTAVEILIACTAMPGNFVRSYYGYWPFGDTACFAFTYFSQIITSGVRFCHLPITINRFWAVTFPVSYRYHHTKKVACCIILGMWIFVHVLHLPVYIPGRMYPRPGDRQCNLNTDFMPIRGAMFLIVGFYVPEIIIICAYPFILYMIYRKRAKAPMSKNRVNVDRGSLSITGKTDETVHVSNYNRSGYSHPYRIPVSIATRLRTAAKASGLVVSQTDEISQVRSVRGSRGYKMSASNRTLTLLTVAVLILWTPSNVYYHLVYFHKYWNVPFFAIQTSMVYTISWLNPILFYLALDKLRAAVNQLSFNCTR